MTKQKRPLMNREFTQSDFRDLVKLLVTLTAMTLAVWIPVTMFTSVNLSISTVYVFSMLALLGFITLRRSIRKRRKITTT
jgi:hypothetical protein